MSRMGSMWKRGCALCTWYWYSLRYNCSLPNELEASKERLEILSAYEKSLEGDVKELDAYTDNPYYEEFANRRELLFTNMTVSKNDTSGQASLYQGNIDSISSTIAQYNEKISKLNTVKQCIMEKTIHWIQQKVIIIVWLAVIFLRIIIQLYNMIIRWMNTK